MIIKFDCEISLIQEYFSYKYTSSLLFLEELFFGAFISNGSSFLSPLQALHEKVRHHLLCGVRSLQSLPTFMSISYISLVHRSSPWIPTFSSSVPLDWWMCVSFPSAILDSFVFWFMFELCPIDWRFFILRVLIDYSCWSMLRTCIQYSLLADKHCFLLAPLMFVGFECYYFLYLRSPPPALLQIIEQDWYVAIIWKLLS